jgi:hypothetical protein
VHCHRQDEYIPTLFKGCWKNFQKKWFLVDMHVQPSWENKLLFPPVVKAQWKELSMNVRLAALVKRISELRAARLKVCHCIEEFHHWRIRSLGRRKRRTYTNAHGWPIPTVSLQMVSFPLCPWHTGGYTDVTFAHFVQFYLKKKLTCTWPDCLIRISRSHDR